MAKVRFLSNVKYRGRYYLAHQDFEVDSADLDALVTLGAIIVSKDNPAEKKEKVEEIKVPEKEGPAAPKASSKKKSK